VAGEPGTEAVRKHWRYFKYVLRHKWYVFLAGRQRGVGLWQLLVHDLSKFRPDEWQPYAEWFYGYEGGPWFKVLQATKHPGGLIPTTKASTGQAHPESELGWELRQKAQAREEAFQKAFLLHLHRNPHHHQYWTLPGYGDKPARAFIIPDKYTREMLADWDGAGRAITGKADTKGWYEKNHKSMTLHPNTQFYVEATLGIAELSIS
jgi:hypothetical protein